MEFGIARTPFHDMVQQRLGLGRLTCCAKAHVMLLMVELLHDPIYCTSILSTVLVFEVMDLDHQPESPQPKQFCSRVARGTFCAGHFCSGRLSGQVAEQQLTAREVED